MPINPPGYHGKRTPLASAITCAVSLDRSSGTTTGACPACVYAHAVATTGTGIDFPFDEIHYDWDFGDTSAQDLITHPIHGGTVDPNTCQVGPIAAFAYRTAGVYTITCTPKILVSGSGTAGDPWVWVHGTPATATFTVTNWSGTDRYYDSVGGTPGGAGTIGDPISSESDLRTWLRAGNDRRAFIKAGSTFTLTATWNISPSTNITRTGQRIEKYGSGADPIITTSVTGGTQMVHFNINNASINCNDFCASQIVFDGNDEIKWVFYIAQSAGSVSNICLDRCTFKGAGPDTADGTKPLHVGTVDGMGLGISSLYHWRCTIDCELEAETGELCEGNGNYFVWFNCTCKGGKVGNGVDTVLDHYIYPSKCSHCLFSHIDFQNSAGDFCYCVNLNAYTTGSGGAVVNDYVLFTDCNVSGTRNGFDASGTNGNPNQGVFGNVIVQRCAFHDLGHIVDTVVNPNSSTSWILYYGCRRMTLRDCIGCGNDPDFGNGSSVIHLGEDSGKEWAAGLHTTLNVYRNRCEIGTGLGANLAWLHIANMLNIQPDGLIEDNVIIDRRTAARAVRIPFAKLPSMTFNNNLYYAPNDSSVGFNNITSGSTVDETTFETTHGFGADAFTCFNTSNPDWSSPQTGDFELRHVVATDDDQTIEYDSGDTLTDENSPFDLDEVGSQSFRLYNGSPNKLLTLSNGGYSVGGHGTLGTNPVASASVPLPPGEYATIGVGLLTSVAGTKAAVLTMSSDDAATPFTLTDEFVVTGAAVPPTTAVVGVGRYFRVPERR